jgi:hypothetical protein
MTSPTTSRTNTEEPPERVILSGRAVAQLVELLDHCYAFFDGNEGVQAELREYCQTQPYGVTSFWVIDQLAWHALLLRVQLAEQAEEDRRRA